MTLSLALVLSMLGPAEAAELAHRADRLYAEEKFGEASAAYAEAFEADENPDYLYGWAQSERRAGNCIRAVELYRDYAELPVSEAAREAAAKNAKRCGGDIEETDTPPPPVVEPTPEHKPRRKRDNDEAWRSDALGLGLVTGGAALGIAAVVLAVDSQQQWRLAESAELEATYARKIERSNRTRTAAIVCGSVGAAALAVGAIRLFMVQNKEARARATAWQPGRGLRF